MDFVYNLAGMYGERIGAFTFLCGDEESAAKVLSQVKIMIRTMYSNAPRYGARLVKEILNNNELRQQWLVDGVFSCIIPFLCKNLLNSLSYNNLYAHQRA